MSAIEPHKLAFVDIETTGLDPERHEIWEIGLIIDEVEADGTVSVGTSREFYPEVKRLGDADPQALRIGDFYHRKPRVMGMVQSEVATRLAPLLVDVYLVGCTVHFDAGFLSHFLRANGHAPMWNYHLIDATTFAAGRAGMQPPYKSIAVADRFKGVRNDEVSHRALNDAQMARRLYYAALGRLTDDGAIITQRGDS